MDGFRCEAWLTVLSIRRVGLSPVQVPPAMPAGEMLLLVDLIELARAIDRHWLPHVRHIARRVRHAGLFLELPTWKPGIFREVISIRSFRPLHPKIRSISITISTEQFHQMFVSFLFYFVRFFFQFFEDPFGVGEKFLWILIESLIGLKNKSWIRWLVSNFLRLSHHFSIVINCVKCYRISSFNNVKSRSIFLSTTTTT